MAIRYEMHVVPQLRLRRGKAHRHLRRAAANRVD
jgi:hypothetical protein